MSNLFTDNPDMLFHFDNLDLAEITGLVEEDYREYGEYSYAPKDYEDARDNYRKVLEIVGDIAGNVVAPRAAEVDEEGSHFNNGKVTYAAGTINSLKQLSQADLMGMTLPRKYGGLNFPTSIYVMAVEMISRADASLMNLFGLQDIGETVYKFGTDEQKAEFLPKLASGECTGAMVLTEPDAGSDLQAVMLQAHEDDAGNWYLNGMKRFITNGCGDILLVLARSEEGTKDGRGLSMFVCYGDDTVEVRRIENKLGIHGSPTCELQFKNTPAQLVGKRKFGLIKYVMDLMNGARLGISAQALGISQAAYEEALAYAKVREQFGQAIYHIPVVTNMLVDMRVALEANRSLLYETARWVDRRTQFEELAARLKAAGSDAGDASKAHKQAVQMAALLTPISKYTLSESANRISDDALQIHGGAGYMKEFPIERLVRDARITNIYEGTSQLQIVAAIGNVMKDILAERFDEWGSKPFPGALQSLTETMLEIRDIFNDCREFVSERQDKHFQEVSAKHLVDLYTILLCGYLLLDEAQLDGHKVFIANRYITQGLAQARQHQETIKSEQFADLVHADSILI